MKLNHVRSYARFLLFCVFLGWVSEQRSAPPVVIAILAAKGVEAVVVAKIAFIKAAATKIGFMGIAKLLGAGGAKAVATKTVATVVAKELVKEATKLTAKTVLKSAAIASTGLKAAEVATILSKKATESATEEFKKVATKATVQAIITAPVTTTSTALKIATAAAEVLTKATSVTKEVVASAAPIAAQIVSTAAQTLPVTPIASTLQEVTIKAVQDHAQSSAQELDQPPAKVNEEPLLAKSDTPNSSSPSNNDNQNYKKKRRDDDDPKKDKNDDDHVYDKDNESRSLLLLAAEGLAGGLAGGAVHDAVNKDKDEAKHSLVPIHQSVTEAKTIDTSIDCKVISGIDPDSSKQREYNDHKDEVTGHKSHIEVHQEQNRGVVITSSGAVQTISTNTPARSNTAHTSDHKQPTTQLMGPVLGVAGTASPTLITGAINAAAPVVVPVAVVGGAGVLTYMTFKHGPKVVYEAIKIGVSDYFSGPRTNSKFYANTREFVKEQEDFIKYNPGAAYYTIVEKSDDGIYREITYLEYPTEVGGPRIYIQSVEVDQAKYAGCNLTNHIIAKSYERPLIVGYDTPAAFRAQKAAEEAAAAGILEALGKGPCIGKPIIEKPTNTGCGQPAEQPEKQKPGCGPDPVLPANPLIQPITDPEPKNTEGCGGRLVPETKGSGVMRAEVPNDEPVVVVSLPPKPETPKELTAHDTYDSVPENSIQGVFVDQILSDAALISAQQEKQNIKTNRELFKPATKTENAHPAKSFNINEALKDIPAACAQIDPSVGKTEHVERLITALNNLPGAIKCKNGEGPITKLLKNGTAEETLSVARGAIYELETGYALHIQGKKVAFGEKYRNKNTQKDFDITTETSLIECKDVDWSKYTKGRMDRAFSVLKEQSNIAKDNNKEFIFYTKKALPDYMKNKCIESNINFVEG